MTGGEARGALASAAAALALHLPLLSRGFVLEDEGATVALAARMAGGEVLYRDLAINLGPGVYELYALLFRVTGISYVGARALVAAASALCAAALYVAARRAGGASGAAAAPALFLLTHPLAFPSWHMAMYSPFSMALAVTAMAVALGRPGPWAACLAGALASAAALFKQNYGALALLGCLAAMGLARWPRRLLPWLSLGFASPLLGIAALYAWRGALGDLFTWTVLFALRAQGELFRVPAPPVTTLVAPDAAFRAWFLYYVPPLALETLFPLVAETALWRRTGLVELLLKGAFYLPFVPPALLLLAPAGAERSRERGLGAAGLLFLGLGSYPTPDWAHHGYALPLSLASLAVIAGRTPRRWRACRAALATCGILAAAFLGAALHPYDAELPRIGLRVREGMARPLREASDYLASRGIGDVLVVPYQPGFLHVSGCRNPTRTDIFLPGFVSDADLRDALDFVDRGGAVVRFSKEYAHLRPFAASFAGISSRLEGEPEARFQGDGFTIEIHRRRPPRTGP